MVPYWGFHVNFCCFWVGHSAARISLSELEYVLLGIGMASAQATRANPFICPLWKHWDDGGGQLPTLYQMGQIVYLVAQCLCCNGCSWVGMNTGYKEAHYFWKLVENSLWEMIVWCLRIWETKWCLTSRAQGLMKGRKCRAVWRPKKFNKPRRNPWGNLIIN